MAYAYVIEGTGLSFLLVRDKGVTTFWVFTHSPRLSIHLLTAMSCFRSEGKGRLSDSPEQTSLVAWRLPWLHLKHSMVGGSSSSQMSILIALDRVYFELVGNRLQKKVGCRLGCFWKDGCKLFAEWQLKYRIQWMNT